MNKEKEINIAEQIENIRKIFNFLLLKWKTIILFGLIGGCLGLGVSLISKAKYHSTLKFVVEEEGKSGGGIAALASSFGIGGVMGGSTVFSSSNLLEILKTKQMIKDALLRPVREKEYENLTYAELFIKENNWRENWSNDSKLKRIRFKVGENSEDFSREKDSIIGEIHRMLIEDKLIDVIHPIEENSIVHLKVKSTNEVFSKNFPLELMDVATKFYLESKTKKSKSSVIVLQKQVDSVRIELYKSMGAVASANDAVFGLNPAMNVKRVTSSKQQAQTQMNIAVLQELVKNLEIAKLKLMDDTPVIEIVEKPVYPLEVEKIRKLKGIVLGGLIFGFLIVGFYIIKLFLKKILNS